MRPHWGFSLPIDELNMANYDEDEVSALDQAAIEAAIVLDHVMSCLKTVAKLLCGIEFNIPESPRKVVLSIEIKNLIHQIRLLDSIL